MRVAVATSTGAFIDEHFGQATRFLIFELTETGFHQVAVRESRQGCGGGCDCGAEKPVQSAVELATDCQAVLVTQIGDHGLKRLAARGILAFESTDPVGEALQELADHEAVAPYRAPFARDPS
jgi:nitrogen fixation protein NifB